MRLVENNGHIVNTRHDKRFILLSFESPVGSNTSAVDVRSRGDEWPGVSATPCCLPYAETACASATRALLSACECHIHVHIPQVYFRQLPARIYRRPLTRGQV